MSDEPSSFARAAPGVRAATALYAGEFLHTYAGRLESAPGEVRLLVLSPEQTDPAVESAFQRVAENWGRISGRPGVVSVYDRGETPRPWLAVEAVDGTRLSECDAPLSVDAVRSVLSGVAEVLRGAGQTGVHHGSLSPEDIWLVGGPDDVRIDGWGLDRACQVAAGQRPATPYTAPGLAAGEVSPGDRTDVFSLGAVAYYALTGETPQTDDTPQTGDAPAGPATGSASHGAGRSRPRASTMNASVPAQFDTVLETALATDPAARYDTPYEFKLAALFDSHEDPQPDAGAGDGVPEQETPSRGGCQPAAGSDDAREAAAGPEGDEQEASAGSVGGYPLSRRAALGAVGLGIVGAAGWLATQQLGGSGAPDGVPQFQYDAGNTGHAVATDGPTDGVEVDWRAESSPRVVQPIVSRGTVFLGDRGRLLAIDATDGSEQWTLDREGFWSLPAVSDGRAHFVRTKRKDDGDAEFSLHAFDADGTEQWQSAPIEAGVRRIQVPTIADDRLYFGTSIGIHGFDLETESEVWRYDDLDDFGPILTADDERVYVSTRDGVHAINREDETGQWSVTGDSLWGITAVDGIVYFPQWDGTDSEISALDGETGEARWTITLDERAVGPTTVADGTLFAGTGNGKVLAIDTDDGSTVWTRQLADNPVPPGTIAGDVLYLRNTEGNVFALDVGDGSEQWSTTVEDVIGIPAVIDGAVYISSPERLFRLSET
ncbi:hypothetical protein BRD19_08940 [Halobacteriales archaeon SW_7_65_23]|nr:MAG: hypothetical protein BRD19_08940 [Halobacteriales archaeon SW_7_65_23]